MEKSRLKMTNEEAIKIIENEKLCVVTRDKGYCNGGTDCSTCNLVKPTYHIIDGFDKAIEALQEQERKWIPVSERLPKEYETVIGVTDLNYYCIAVYCKQYGFRSMDVGVESDIIAWQPLPEPFEGSEGE